MSIENSVIGFMGPLPPPIGGVAIMNKNIQKLLGSHYEIEFFNTSRNRKREDLYSKKNIEDYYIQLKIIFNGVRFIYSTKAKIINLFVTSNISFLREIVFLSIAAIMRKKIVIHLHTKSKGEIFVKKYSIRLFSLILSLADKILVLSDMHYEFFSKYINVTKLQVLENFVFSDKYIPDSSRKKLNFLYVGRLTKEKGIYDLINAVIMVRKEIPDFKIHIVGLAESETAENKLLELIYLKNLEDCFIFHGTVYGEQKYNIFRACDIFVFPSHFENSPVVLKEALAAKQIIVCSDIESNKNMLKEFNVKSILYYKVFSAEELSNNIIYVYKNINNLSCCAHKLKFPNKYTAQFASDVLNNVYSQIGISI